MDGGQKASSGLIFYFLSRLKALEATGDGIIFSFPIFIEKVANSVFRIIFWYLEMLLYATPYGVY